MMAVVAILPRFKKEQQVSFVGGLGIIKDYLPEAGTWTYLIEMEMGLEPEMGRIGNETRVLLPETDICLSQD
ncbi:hypothetical protein I8748_20530 [Nostoc sp. CENA67]|uniref:Uncharacterized protein n=1 Tax=Amazonocrinis nigriterrae CENA67 TaxID=2794033 RepID=A0A8J7HUN9_9NOST|nr:hypothetical protein [Amazonocrinis nigriterrae]MBH8564540.1 hypothetical protein [Amazonocrinis nigriterrae CENA67]